MISPKVIVLSTGVAAAVTTLLFLYNWVKSKKKPPERKNQSDIHTTYNTEQPSTANKLSKKDNDHLEILSKHEEKEELVNEWVNNNPCDIMRERNSNSDSCFTIQSESCQKRKHVSDSDSGSPVIDEVIVPLLQSLENSSHTTDIYDISAQSEKQLYFQHADSEEDSGFHKKGLDGDSNSASSKDVCEELAISDKGDTPSDPIQNSFSPATTPDQCQCEPPTELSMPPWDQDEDVSTQSFAEEMIDSLLRDEEEDTTTPNTSDLADSSLEQASVIDSDVVEYIDAQGMRRTLHFFAPEDMPEEFGGSCLNSQMDAMDTEMHPREGEIIFTRCVPQQFCGLIFGRHGRNAKELREKYDCRLQLTNTPYDPMSHTLQFVCPEVHLYEVERWFRHKIRICQTLGSNLGTNVANPLKLLKRLPLGKIVPVFVLGLESPTELYVQIYDPEEYDNFQRFQSALDQHYLTEDCPHLPTPVGRGAICIAPYLDGHFYRVRITDQQVLPTGEVMVTVFYLDFGGQLNHSISSLYKIKEEFMRFPFQSILVRWAHAESVLADPGEVYSQLFQNRSLYAHTVTIDTMDIDHAVIFASTGAPNELIDLLQEANAAGLYNLASYSNCRIALSEHKPGQQVIPLRYWPPQIGSVDYTSLLIDPEPDIEPFEEESNPSYVKHHQVDRSSRGRRSKDNRTSNSYRGQQQTRGRGRHNRYSRHPASKGRGHNPEAGESRKILKT